jgi:hypothetical protein
MRLWSVDARRAEWFLPYSAIFSGVPMSGGMPRDGELTTMYLHTCSTYGELRTYSLHYAIESSKTMGHILLNAPHVRASERLEGLADEGL